MTRSTYALIRLIKTSSFLIPAQRFCKKRCINIKKRWSSWHDYGVITEQ